MGINLLTDNLIRVERLDGSCIEASLSQVYALLMDDVVRAFPALRPHQRHAWHAFLVQTAASALYRANANAIPCTAEGWKHTLRSLTPAFDRDEPWTLAHDDDSVPAFMQSPSRMEDFNKPILTPGGLDVLVTSKNHEIKQDVRNSRVDDWLFALVTLQTMSGYPGQGNYGISRMNGGHGNRPAFSLAPTTQWGRHVRRDLSVLIERREEVVSRFGLNDGGIDLLWLVPWNEAKSKPLALAELAPFYVEICRRVRLRANSEGRLYGLRAASKGPRIVSGLKGLTGDPWTPVKKEDPKALSLSVGGFTYKRVVEYLDASQWEYPMTLDPAGDEGTDGALLIARGIVGGQGRTDGYYERVIPVQAGLTASDLGGVVARERVEQIGLVERALRSAVAAFEQAGGGRASGNARKWAAALSGAMDRTFFEDLQTELTLDDEKAQEAARKKWWRETLYSNARAELRNAQQSIPCRTARRYEAVVRSNGAFHGYLHKHAHGMMEKERKHDYE